MREAVRVLVVDDEPLAREGMRLLCQADPDVIVVGEAADGHSAADAIRTLVPDLVFFDVELPASSAFQALERLGAGPRPLVVFVTAYDRYAVRAFDVRAVDYLLKPFTDERFAESLARAKELLAPRRPVSRIMVRESGRTRYVDVDSIDWVEAADYYVELHLGDTSILHRETMQSLETALDPVRFVRIHRRAIVNIDRVREIVRCGRRWNVVLAAGVTLPLSGRARARLLGR